MDEKKNLYTFENKEYRDTYRHSTSHVLAQAVKRLYPEAKLAIGPAIDDGFYYDIDSDVTFTPEVLEKLEAEMRKICKEKLPIERFELPRDEALKLMEERNEPYKVELINDLPEDSTISFYKQGEFVRRPPPGQHRPHQGQRHQAYELHRRVLARRQQEQDAPAHLRHLLYEKGGT